MGHTLFIWSVTVLACQTDGQIVGQPTPCASCQAAQAAQQMEQMPVIQYEEDAPPPRGLFRSRDEGEPRPGIFARMQNRISSWFSRPQQMQTPPQLGAPVVDGYSRPTYSSPSPYVNISTVEPPTSLPPISNRPGAFPAVATTEPPISNRPSALPAVANTEPPASEPAVLPASLRPTGSTETGGEPAAIPAAYTSEQATNIVPVTKMTIDPRAMNMGHESDYSWITGRISIVNGSCMIEYSLPGAVDQFGGKLQLVNVDARNLQDGDFVCVWGALMSSGGRIVGAYRVSSMSVFDRPRQ